MWARRALVEGARRDIRTFIILTRHHAWFRAVRSPALAPTSARAAARALSQCVRGRVSLQRPSLSVVGCCCAWLARLAGGLGRWIHAEQGGTSAKKNREECGRSGLRAPLFKVVVRSQSILSGFFLSGPRYVSPRNEGSPQDSGAPLAHLLSPLKPEIPSTTPQFRAMTLSCASTNPRRVNIARASASRRPAAAFGQ